jgi:hypothetical protein
VNEEHEKHLYMLCQALQRLELLKLQGPPPDPGWILCLRCGAKPRVPCRTRGGNKARVLHGRRCDDWKRIVGRDILGRLPSHPDFMRGETDAS